MFTFRAPTSTFRAIPNSCLRGQNRQNLYIWNLRYTVHCFDREIFHRNISIRLYDQSTTKESNERCTKIVKGIHFPIENWRLQKWRRGPSRRAVVTLAITVQRFWEISYTKILSASQRKGCPTNPRYAQAYFGTPPWTVLRPFPNPKIPKSQVPVSPSSTKSTSKSQ